MIKLPILILMTVVCCWGQAIFQVTASQGDGSTCTGTQNSGTNVNFTFTCVSVYQGKPSGSYRIYEGGSAQVKAAVPHTVQLGDILCMFGDNPTNFTVNFPFVPSAPPHSLSYNCAITTRMGGVATGDIAGPSGVVTWSVLTQHGFWYHLFHR